MAGQGVGVHDRSESKGHAAFSGGALGTSCSSFPPQMSASEDFGVRLSTGVLVNVSHASLNALAAVHRTSNAALIWTELNGR